jgi:uncharacterized protein with FMN-binding domain
MRRALAAAFGAATIAVPTANATAASRKVITATKTVTGSQAVADRWGYVQVTLAVKKTTTIVGTHKTVRRKITKVVVPVYPNHTDRSVFINEQALPLLIQEELQAQFNLSSLQLVSGATATSYAFAQSLQAALVKAKAV